MHLETAEPASYVLLTAPTPRHLDQLSRFHAVDYVTLVITLLISCAIGLYHGCFGRVRHLWNSPRRVAPPNNDKTAATTTTEEFLMAGRQMSVLPVTLSLFVSVLSAIAFIGDPVEVYNHGAVYIFSYVATFPAFIVIASVFAPVFFRLRITSVYEYLEQRYNYTIRVFVSLLQIIGAVLYTGVALYAPSLALSQVSGVDVWLAITVAGSCCTFYSTIGGMKAVLWADTFQFFIMTAGLITLAVEGCVRLGGISNIWTISRLGGRLNFNSFDPNPLTRSTFWSYLIGGFWRTVTIFVCQQMCVQRYCSLPSVRKVKVALYLNVPLFVAYGALFTLIGLILYAFYANCDPMKAGLVNKPDQMIPLLVVDLLQYLPGVPGLFVGALFSAALSTLSSVQSALAANFLSDVVQPAHQWFYQRPIADRASVICAKILVVVFGAINVIASLLIVELKNSSVYQMTLVFTGSMHGPVCGIFIAGMLFPFLKTRDVLIGSGVGLVVACWLAFGALITGVTHNQLPVSARSCFAASVNATTVSSGWFDRFNSTTVAAATRTSLVADVTRDQSAAFSQVYKFSPILYTAVGPFLTVTVAILTSAVCVLCRRIFSKHSKLQNSCTHKTNDTNGVDNEGSDLQTTSL